MSYLFSSRKHGRKGVKVKIPVYPCTTYKEPDKKTDACDEKEPDKETTACDENISNKSITPTNHYKVRAGANWRT